VGGRDVPELLSEGGDVKDFPKEKLVALRMRGEIPVCTRCLHLVNRVQQTGAIHSFCEKKKSRLDNRGLDGMRELNLTPCADFEPDTREPGKRFICSGSGECSW